MLKKVSRTGLWVSTIVVLIISAIQGLSGHWIAFYVYWPGQTSFGQNVIQILIRVSQYHIRAGFAVGVISVLILFFAFFSKSNILVRIFAVVGFIIVVLAVMGGFLYVTSNYQDRLALGQMADAFIGLFAAYFLQLIFIIKTPGFLRSRSKAA